MDSTIHNYIHNVDVVMLSSGDGIDGDKTFFRYRQALGEFSNHIVQVHHKFSTSLVQAVLF